MSSGETSCYPTFLLLLGVKEGYPLKERDNAMNEDIFLQVIIILVIVIYGNQKKDANK